MKGFSEVKDFCNGNMSKNGVLGDGILRLKGFSETGFWKRRDFERHDFGKEGIF